MDLIPELGQRLVLAVVISKKDAEVIWGRRSASLFAFFEQSSSNRLDSLQGRCTKGIILMAQGLERLLGEVAISPLERIAPFAYRFPDMGGRVGKRGSRRHTAIVLQFFVTRLSTVPATTLYIGLFHLRPLSSFEKALSADDQITG